MTLPTNYTNGETIYATDINSWTTAINADFTRLVVSVTGVQTLGNAASTDYVALIGSGGVVSLPDASTVGNNRYTVKNIDTVNHTVSTTTGDVIDGGGTTITLASASSVDLISDGSNWRII
jgi:hypothetical protein